MSKVEFDINKWRKKHVLIEGVGGVVSPNPFLKTKTFFRQEHPALLAQVLSH